MGRMQEDHLEESFIKNGTGFLSCRVNKLLTEFLTVIHEALFFLFFYICFN